MLSDKTGKIIASDVSSPPSAASIRSSLSGDDDNLEQVVSSDAARPRSFSVKRYEKERGGSFGWRVRHVPMKQGFLLVGVASHILVFWPVKFLRTITGAPSCAGVMTILVVSPERWLAACGLRSLALWSPAIAAPASKGSASTADMISLRMVRSFHFERAGKHC